MLEPDNQSVSVREYLFEPLSAIERDSWLEQMRVMKKEKKEGDFISFNFNIEKRKYVCNCMEATEAAAKDDKHPEAARRSSTYDASSTLVRGHSIRNRSGSSSTGMDREQDPYNGVTTLLQQLGCAHALQEFKNKGCSDAVAADLKADELVKSFGLAPVKAQVACLSHRAAVPLPRLFHHCYYFRSSSPNLKK